VALSQAPKGHIPSASPTYGLLGYKCRASGALFLRRIYADWAVGAETRINAPPCIGGVDFCINSDSILFHIDAVVDGKLVPMTASSEDQGRTISFLVKLDLSGFSPDAFIPTSSPITRDYSGNFHVPVAAIKSGQQHLLDVHDGHAVEAMVLDGRGFGYNLLVFPKSPGPGVKGRGDGKTDGIGIIATTLNDGKLMISNSQAGGYHYPSERTVNHEMAQMFAFRATECCYTRAQSANMVSMDYIFVEANGRWRLVVRYVVA
jgi:hypothetical protein